MTKIARFDAAEFLDSEEAIAEYLSAALEDPNRTYSLRRLPTWPRPVA